MRPLYRQQRSPDYNSSQDTPSRRLLKLFTNWSIKKTSRRSKWRTRLPPSTLSLAHHWQAQGHDSHIRAGILADAGEHRACTHDGSAAGYCQCPAGRASTGMPTFRRREILFNAHMAVTGIIFPSFFIPIPSQSSTGTPLQRLMPPKNL